MTLNEVKLSIIAKKNEAVSGLVNGNLEDKAAYRYVQGYIHGLDAAFVFLQQLGITKIEDDE